MPRRKKETIISTSPNNLTNDTKDAAKPVKAKAKAKVKATTQDVGKSTKDTTKPTKTTTKPKVQGGGKHRKHNASNPILQGNESLSASTNIDKNVQDVAQRIINMFPEIATDDEGQNGGAHVMDRDTINAKLREMDIDKDDTWKVIDSYFAQYGGRQIVSHHFYSYEQFIEKYMQDVINQFNPIPIYHQFDNMIKKHILEMSIRLTNYTIGSPIVSEPDEETILLTPAMARDRNLSYSAPLTVDIEMTRTVRIKDPETVEKWNEWDRQYGHLIKRPGRPTKDRIAATAANGTNAGGTEPRKKSDASTDVNINVNVNNSANEEQKQEQDQEQEQEDIVIPPAPEVLYTENVKTATVYRINFGKIPVMVGSKYCNLTKQGVHPAQASECEVDMGGYFIVNGNEKVIIGQERIAENKIFVFNKQKQNKGREYEAEVRSIVDDGFNIVMTNIVKYNPKRHTMHVDMGGNAFLRPHNLFIIMKALGVKTDEDLINCIAVDYKDPVLGKQLSSLCRETMNEFKKICNNEKEGGMHTVDDIREYLIRNMKLRNPNRDVVMTQEDKIQALITGLQTELLPHMRNNLDKKALFLGAMARKLLKVRLGMIEMDDRDSFQNKRVETTGYLLASLFRQCLNSLVKEMIKGISKEMKNVVNKDTGVVTHEILDVITINNIYKVVRPTCVENGMKYSMATGNWGIKSGGKGKTRVSVARMLSRLSYLSYLSDLCRVVCPSDKKRKSGKIVGPRKQHASQWGMICPCETPEGQPVGLIKNKAIAATITMQYNSAPVRIWLEDTVCVEPATLDSINESHGKCMIFVNGDIIGYHSAPEKVFSQFKCMRRSGKFNPFITINWDVVNDEMFIFTDAGRLIRPLYIVDSENRLRIRKWHIDQLNTASKNGNTWNSLIIPGADKRINQLPKEYFNTLVSTKSSDSDTFSSTISVSAQDMMSKFANMNKDSQAVIEYVDIEEVNSCLIAMTPAELKDENRRQLEYINQYTHCEIHPGLILGILACVIPFPDHNQSPRNAYQSCMGKQAMSCSTTNLLHRLDTMAYFMCHLEKPIIKSRFAPYVHYDRLPYGMNAIVAIATYGGYNQEDSIILNGHSVDMGMFRTMYYRVHKSDEKKVQNHKEEKFCKPDPRYTKGTKPGSYDKLDERGFARVNEYVTSRDVIMGKKYPLKGEKHNGHQMCKDSSVSLKINESGYVDRVFVSRNEEGYLTGKVRLRDERIPSIGSKFASRNAQKGTVGMILPREQMPFTASGLSPDIIMTPHAIPSRMTIGQLLECILGKAAVHYGGFSECTPFAELDVNKIGDILESQGYEACGNEILYCGITGEQLNVQIFMGPTYYQRLKHMAEDKMHSRNSGPVVQLTRQPAEGRSREGGLRVGEMEKDCLNSHGAAAFLNERMFKVSDPFEMYVCGHCGSAAVVNPSEEVDIYRCDLCENYNNFKRVGVPYAAKLLSQEIQGMGMQLRLK